MCQFSPLHLLVICFQHSFVSAVKLCQELRNQFSRLLFETFNKVCPCFILKFYLFHPFVSRMINKDTWGCLCLSLKVENKCCRSLNFPPEVDDVRCLVGHLQTSASRGRSPALVLDQLFAGSSMEMMETRLLIYVSIKKQFKLHIWGYYFTFYPSLSLTVIELMWKFSFGSEELYL